MSVVEQSQTFLDSLGHDCCQCEALEETECEYCATLAHFASLIRYARSLEAREKRTVGFGELGDARCSQR
jgi:hypothetical protein